MTMNLSIRSLAVAALSSALFLSAAVAQAGDYELWREQVSTSQAEAKLQDTGRYTRSQTSALWREQVKRDSEYLPVFSTKRIRQADGRNLMWREQVPASPTLESGRLIAAE